MEIGHYLKKTSESKKLSHHDVDGHLEVSQKTLSNIERDKSEPSVAQLALMEIYEIDILKLLADNGIHLSPPKSSQG